MNLLAKSLGQLALLAVALFFFSCEDPTSLGFENPTPKFAVNYVDIPLQSSVWMLDSVPTHNFMFSGEVNRLMAGQYMDPQFGNISAAFYTQYFTTSGTKLDATAELDSVSLQLTYDFYTYGSPTNSLQTISVYNVSEDLGMARGLAHNSEVDVQPTPIGTKTFSVDPDAFKEYISDNTDTTLTLKISLVKEFGDEIFHYARQFSIAGDSTYIRFSEFIKLFKGISVKSDAGDKIIRFNPASTSSRIILHYHTDEKDSLESYLAFASTAQFTQIVADRSGTGLAGVTTPFQDYLQDSPLRYVQSGTGIFTKIDLSPFYGFSDTVPSAIINSAQLIISDIESSSFDPPTAFALRLLNNENKERVFSRLNEQDFTDVQNYQPYLRFDIATNTENPAIYPDSVFYVINDLNTAQALTYSSKENTYSGFLTSFFQKMISKDDRSRLQNFILYPLSPKASKSVNRVIFPADKIRLRIYYTVPKNLH